MRESLNACTALVDVKNEWKLKFKKDLSMLNDPNLVDMLFKHQIQLYLITKYLQNPFLCENATSISSKRFWRGLEERGNRFGF